MNTRPYNKGLAPLVGLDPIAQFPSGTKTQVREVCEMSDAQRAAG